MADGAANPYLLQAALIAAGWNGVVEQREPGPRYDNNAYTDPLPLDKVKQLPSNLLDALRCLENDQILSQTLGENFVSSYIKLKSQQWDNYNTEITPWEWKTTLDC